MLSRLLQWLIDRLSASYRKLDEADEKAEAARSKSKIKGK